MNEEALQPIASASADIQRWALLIALKGSASEDRKRDISRTAERIIKLASELMINSEENNDA